VSSSAGRAQHEVVVVGGGFGGLQAVRHLRRAPVSITLVDRRSFHLFQPLVYQVATGMLAAGEIAAPLRSVFKRDRNVRVILGEAGGRHATAASSGRCRAATRRRGAAAGPRRQCPPALQQQHLPLDRHRRRAAGKAAQR
jgi:2-polyprenyl-6-methoxyphenol hydroxylase-like FAD-dependent oxidoreductase